MRQECVFYQVSEIPEKFAHVVFYTRCSKLQYPPSVIFQGPFPQQWGGTGITPPTYRAGTWKLSWIISDLSKADFLNFSAIYCMNLSNDCQYYVV